MPREPDVTRPSRDQLVAIIRIQTEMAKHGKRSINLIYK